MKLALAIIATASALALCLSISPAAIAVPDGDVPDVTPQAGCTAKWYYRNVSRLPDVHTAVGPVMSNYNGTPTASPSTFTASVSGTVGTSISYGNNVSATVKVASISGQYSIGASTSKTVTLGNSTTISVPSHKTGNGAYGAWRAVVNGVEEYTTASCQVTQTVTTKVYTPYRVGWRTWIS